MIRRTKIVATIGPASGSEAALRKLLEAGLDVARLNFSHGSHAEHHRVLQILRRLSREQQRPVAVLQDLAGPKIRVGVIPDGGVDLRAGQPFTLTTQPAHGDEGRVSLDFKELPRYLKQGDPLLLSDGAIELRVTSVTAEDVHCEVVVGGHLTSHKGINLPSSSVDAPVLTRKDRVDLAFGLDIGVDMVAVSFVRTADDIRAVRAFMCEKGQSVPIVAKIEKHEALRDIDAIIDQVDTVMIARGDLGVEIPIEEVPRTQRWLIRKANAATKPVITATQMLKSMVDSPRPSRAEVTDVANAVLNGTDATMLSEETAVGRYPREAVAMMGRIAAITEEDFPHLEWDRQVVDAEERPSWQEAVARSACRLADNVGAAVLVADTQSGSTVRFLAKCRPRQPILAITREESTCRRLALTWGTVPIPVPASCSDADACQAARDKALALGIARSGDSAVLAAGLPLSETGTTNAIRLFSI